MDRRREIYIKINEMTELINILKGINSKNEKLRKLFSQYDTLNIQENAIYENWSNYLEDTFTRMDNLRL